MMSNKQLRKEIQRLEIDAVEYRRRGENEQRVAEQQSDNSSQTAYLAGDAQKRFNEARDMEQRVEQMKQQLEQQENKVGELQSERSHLIEEHDRKIQALDREIANMEG